MNIGQFKSGRTIFEVVLWVALSLLFHWLIGVNWWLDCILAGMVAAGARIGGDYYVIFSEHECTLKQLKEQLSEMSKVKTRD
jgi:hypothetical protein